MSLTFFLRRGRLFSEKKTFKINDIEEKRGNSGKQKKRELNFYRFERKDDVLDIIFLLTTKDKEVKPSYPVPLILKINK